MTSTLLRRHTAVAALLSVSLSGAILLAGSPAQAAFDPDNPQYFELSGASSAFFGSFFVDDRTTSYEVGGNVTKVAQKSTPYTDAANHAHATQIRLPDDVTWEFTQWKGFQKSNEFGGDDPAFVPPVQGNYFDTWASAGPSSTSAAANVGTQAHECAPVGVVTTSTSTVSDVNFAPQEHGWAAAANGPLDFINLVGTASSSLSTTMTDNGGTDTRGVTMVAEASPATYSLRGTSRSYYSLDSALVGAIATRRCGPNSQAAHHFDLMTLGSLPEDA